MQSDPMKAALDQLKVPYQYLANVLLDTINRRASAKRQARYDLIDDAHKEEMRQAWLDGVQFPPIIVWKGPNGFEVLDGKHRVWSADEAGKTTIDAYMVLTEDAYTLDLLARALNVANGMRMSPEEIDSSMVFLAERYKRPATELASVFHANPGRTQDLIRRHRTRKELEMLGVSTVGLGVEALDKLSPLLQQDVEAAKALATVFARGHLGSTEMRELAAAVRSGKTEAERQQMIAEHVSGNGALRDHLAEVGTRQGPTARFVEREGALREMRALLRRLKRGGTLDGLQLTAPEDRRLARELWGQLWETGVRIFEP